jgi:adenylate cyclase
VQGIRASGVARRSDESPFVGRERESGALLNAWAEWNRNPGRAAVIVTGEAGIGKSRLVGTFLARLADRATAVRTESSPFEQRIPYGLWRSILSSLIEMDDRVEPGEIGQRLRSWLALNGFAEEETHPIKLVFGMSQAVEGPLAALPPRTVFRLVCADLYRALEAGARRHGRPLVLALDDLQWADRTSLDILHEIVMEQRPTGVFFVLSHRGDFELPGPPWTGVGALLLQPLDEDARRALFNLLADARELLPEVRDRLLQQAEGNPLFLVEFFSNLGKQGTGVTGHSIPPSLRQMIQARIDALDDRRKTVLQTASVLGRRFAIGLLQIYDHVREDLLARLYALKTAQHLQDDPAADGLHFYFRQNLTREVSYSSLLQKRRREFHLIVAEHLEDLEGPADGDRIQLLAYHFQHAEADRKASHYLELAGDRARAAGAVAESRQAYEAALLSLRRLRRSSDTTAREIAILRSLGILARYAGDPARARALNAEALALAEQLKLRPIAADLRHLGALIDSNSGHAKEAEHVLSRVLTEARRLNLRDLEAKTLNVLGVCAWNRGDIQRAGKFYRRCLDRLGRAGSLDLRADLLSNLGLIAWKRGKLAEAGSLLSRSVAIRRKSGNRFGMALALMNRGIIRENEGATAAARRLYTEALEIARRIHFLQVEGACLANLANLSLGLGHHAEALAFSSRALDSARHAGDHRSEAIARENLALSHIGAPAIRGRRPGTERGDHPCGGHLRPGASPLASPREMRTGPSAGERSCRRDDPRATRSRARRGLPQGRTPRARTALWGESLAASGETSRARKQLAVALREARAQSNRVEERRIEESAGKLRG